VVEQGSAVVRFYGSGKIAGNKIACFPGGARLKAGTPCFRRPEIGGFATLGSRFLGCSEMNHAPLQHWHRTQQRNNGMAGSPAFFIVFD
jgi:hypothetical protein